MNKRMVLLTFSALLSGGTIAASALPITYHVTADTSAVSGTSGSIDFNFNPGPLSSQGASVQVLNFSGDGTPSAGGSTTGNASGALPGTVTFNNGTPYNDFFDPFVYGSTLSFDVYFFGAALSTPDGTSTSGSTFAFSLFSDPAGTLSTLTTDTTNGFGYVVNVNLDGSTTATSYLTSNAGGGGGGGGGGSTGITPEPSSLALLGTATGLGAALLRRVRTRAIFAAE